VPMSENCTGARQLERLCGLGLAPEMLGMMRDVDVIDDARAVAAQAPATGFAAALAAIETRLSAGDRVAV